MGVGGQDMEAHMLEEEAMLVPQVAQVLSPETSMLTAAQFTAAKLAAPLDPQPIAATPVAPPVAAAAGIVVAGEEGAVAMAALLTPEGDVEVMEAVVAGDDDVDVGDDA